MMQKHNYQTWLDKSEDNLRWAKDNFKLKNHALVCYLSQQCVELILKCYLYSKDVIPPRTHNLLKLAEKTKEFDLVIKDFYKHLAKLSEYYYESRYPDELNEKLNREEIAKEAIDMAEEVLNFVKNKLK